MIKARNFTRRATREVATPTTTEKGYVLGSHIRKGLYEPVNPEISGLMRGVYDDDGCKDVDPLCAYRMDKFEKAMLGRTSPESAVAPNPAKPTE